MKHPTWKSEAVGLNQLFRDTPYIVVFIHMFVSSNWFYTYQFNESSAIIKDNYLRLCTRARSPSDRISTWLGSTYETVLLTALSTGPHRSLEV
jgi:hypothetical protein